MERSWVYPIDGDMNLATRGDFTKGNYGQTHGDYGKDKLRITIRHG